MKTFVHIIVLYPTICAWTCNQRWKIAMVHKHVIEVNNNGNHGEESQNDIFNVMLDWENRVLKMLMEEMYC